MTQFSSLPPSDPSADAVASLAGAAALGPRLGEALRAVAEESDSRSFARQLRRLAAAVEQGQPLDEAIATATTRMPSDVRGLLQASLRTGNLPAALAQWIDNRRAATTHWRDTLTSLAYPLLASFTALGVFLLYSWFVAAPLSEMIESFGLKFGRATKIALWCCEHGANLAVAVLVICLLLAAGIRLLGGAAAWSRTMTAMPVFGDLWHWSSVAEMLRSLRLLLEYRVPLAEALELTAGGIRDRYLAKTCSRMANQVREGQTLDAAAEESSLPRSIVPLLRVGKQQATLPEALELATQLLEARLRTISQLVIGLAPSVILVVLAVLVGGMFVGLMLPVLTLISGIT